uniref:Uncharacterized protein n=1 Tax=Pseudomonas aeruginosa TaxID=287 RepID=A0A2S1JKV2_PSEAI|nr:hypothetical protein [Pseudomonas aeruginosa]
MVDRAGGIARFGDAGQLPASSLVTMLQDDSARPSAGLPRQKWRCSRKKPGDRRASFLCGPG